MTRCRIESITKTILPGAAVGAAIFYYLTKSIKKWRLHFSAVGMVVGLGLGKAAYNPICVDRLMTIGDGNLRKSFEQFSERYNDKKHQKYKKLSMKTFYRNNSIPIVSSRVQDGTGDFTRLDTLPETS